MGQKMDGLVESVKIAGLSSDRPNHIRLSGHPFTYEIRAGLVDNGTDREFVLLDLAVRPDAGKRISAESLKKVSVKLAVERLAAAACVLGYVKPGDGPMFTYNVPDKSRPETAREVPWEDLAMTATPPAEKPRRGRPPRDKAISRQAKVVYAEAIERGYKPTDARQKVRETVKPPGFKESDMVSHKTVQRWLADPDD